MSDEEREGTAEDFADMFARPKQRNHDLIVALAGAPDEPEQQVDQSPEEEVDQRHIGLAEQFGLPVRVAALINLDQPLDKVFANAKALQVHVHGPPKPVDFDGGVRETAPMPTNPAREHNDFLLDVMRQGQGSGWQ